MEIGYIGLGKMGENMVKNLIDNGHDVIAYNRSPEPVERVEEYGATGAYSLEELVEEMNAEQKKIWVMVPHQVVGDVIDDLKQHLDSGDIVIDGGNTHFEKSKKHKEKLEELEIHYMDIGVSGGPGGARHGACMMAGGEEDIWEKLEPLVADLCVEDGYGYFGPSPSGHFVKMVHNGIEYGMMQAIAEGFDVLEKSELDIDLQKAAKVYNNGAVIESSLIRWLNEGYEEFGEELDGVSGKADESGEGRWTTQVAEDLGVPTDVIEDALDARLRSQENPNYQGQIITLLRHKFGHHPLDGA